MKVTKKLNVPASYVYKCILDSALHDISEHTGKTVSSSQLVGFQYDKEIGERKAAIEIVDLDPEKKYQFSTTTDRNIFHTLYEIEALSDESCQVHYAETITSSGAIQTLNDQLVGIIFSSFKKKRVKQLLEQIEASGLATTNS